MAVAVTIARLLLGLLFVASGAAGFFLIAHPPPPPPGLAGDFMHVYFGSRWVLAVDAIQFAAGALLLADRFVPLALVTLAAVLYNILVFHLTMQPAGIVPGLVAVVLWIIVARAHRASFAPLLVAKSVDPVR